MPVIKFEDGTDALVSEFMLAEARSFADPIIDALESASDARPSSFAGNAFSILCREKETVITDDIMGRECKATTSELLRLARDYRGYCEAQTHEDGRKKRGK